MNTMKNTWNRYKFDTMDYNDRSLLNTIIKSCHFMFFYSFFFYIYSYIQLMGAFYARKYVLYV